MARALVLVAALLAGCSALRPDFTAVVQSEGAAVVAISRGVREDLIHHFGPPAARAIVIHNPAYDEVAATAITPPAIPLPAGLAGSYILT